jgi:alkyl sulfatase BDS1-like metallo-beta-lactamase superfamily hydrolase
MYAYLHDQTLRLLNQGYTGIEIAEMIELPPALENAWHVRGYYGSVSHNVKAIYQHYMGWFDGNPAHLWQLPPVEAAKKYVAAMGGAAAVREQARTALEGGELRWAAQLLDHAVFADPGDKEARKLLADTYTRLGHGAENATWRNYFLSGAQELLADEIPPYQVTPMGPELAMALSVDQVFDSLAIRVNGPKAWDNTLTIDWHFTDLGQNVRLRLHNGVLIQTKPTPDEAPDLAVTLTKPQLLALIGRNSTDGVQLDGDSSALATLVGVLDSPDPNFPIVTP